MINHKLPGKFPALLAMTVLLAAQGSLSLNTASAQDAYGRPGKDFTHRKRMIVPSSDSNRRIDYQALPGRDSLMLPNYAPQFPPAGAGQTEDNTNSHASALPPEEGQTPLSARAQSLSGRSAGTTKKPLTKVSRAGLVPPAPPVKQSLLPNSLTHDMNMNMNTNTASISSSGSSGSSVKSALPPLTSQKVMQLKAEAEALVKKGKAAEAQTLLSGYVKNHPQEKTLAAELSRISLNRAQTSARAGSYESAAEQARLAIINGASVPEVALAAHAILNNSIKKIGVANTANARLEMAAKLMNQSRYNEAEVEYQASAKLKPSVDAYLGAGEAALEDGRKIQAKAFFQEALELNPNSQPALREMGMARYQLKDYVGANADLTRALVLDASDPQAAKTLIGLWHEQVASRPQDATSHLGLARAYQVAGDLPAAQAEYKTVVKISPNHPNLPAARQSFKLAFARQEAKKAYELAQTLETQGAIASAYQKANDAVGFYPSDLRYQNYRQKLANIMNGASAVNSTAEAMPGFAPEAGTSALTMPAIAGDRQNGMPETAVTEAPPAVALPTAQAIGIAPETAAAAAVSSAAAGDTAIQSGLSTDQHVASISNFLTSMRDFSLQQQNQIKQQEDFSEVVLDTIGNGGVPKVRSRRSSLSASSAFPSSSSSSSSLPADDSDLSSTPGAAPAGVESLPESKSAADALKAAVMALGNTRGKGVVSSEETAALTAAADRAAGAPATTEAASSFAGFAAQAKEAYSGGGATGIAALTANAAPAMFHGKYALINKKDTIAAAQQAAHRYAVKAATRNPTLAKSAAPPAVPQPGSYGTEHQLSSLKNNQANNYIQQLQNGKTPPVELAPEVLPLNPSESTPPLSNLSAPASSPSSPLSSPSLAATSDSLETLARPINLPRSAGSAIATATAAAPELHLHTSPAATPAALSVSATDTMQARRALSHGEVHLFLQGVKASRDDVQLKVMLRNEGQEEIKLPSAMKVLVRSSGQPDKLAKATFSAKSVAGGATVGGTIKIPGRSLDPTADVIIPASSLAVLGLSDIHLTVPISQR